jgi:hypothetical protein
MDNRVSICSESPQQPTLEKSDHHRQYMNAIRERTVTPSQLLPHSDIEAGAYAFQMIIHSSQIRQRKTKKRLAVVVSSNTTDDGTASTGLLKRHRVSNENKTVETSTATSTATTDQEETEEKNEGVVKEGKFMNPINNDKNNMDGPEKQNKKSKKETRQKKEKKETRQKKEPKQKKEKKETKQKKEKKENKETKEQENKKMDDDTIPLKQKKKRGRPPGKPNKVKVLTLELPISTKASETGVPNLEIPMLVTPMTETASNNTNLIPTPTTILISNPTPILISTLTSKRGRGRPKGSRPQPPTVQPPIVQSPIVQVLNVQPPNVPIDSESTPNSQEIGHDNSGYH